MEGEVTLHEGDTVSTLTAGHWATFKAGVPLGHCFVNDSASEVRLMVVGTRTGADVGHLSR